jgi:quercetin dioxygenase-like cupin family protein
MRSTRHAVLDRWSLRAVARQLASSLSSDLELPGVGRRYQRLDVGRFAGQVDAWLIAWPPGSGLPMHDHDGSGAVVHVVRSALRERYVADGLIIERALVAGDRVHLPPEHLHEITNVAGEEALSLHVYSPRLTMVRFRSEFGELTAAPSTRQLTIEADFAS